MVKIGNLILNELPRVAVSLHDRLSPEFLRRVIKSGVDVIELRIDLYASAELPHILEQIAQCRELPTLATIRSREEGGSWKGSEEERLKLYLSVIPHVDAVDIELSSVQVLAPAADAARKAGKTVIASYHNFEKMPSGEDLLGVLRKAKSAGADIAKIAALAASREEVQSLAKFTLENAGENIITIAMGEEGAASRIFFPGFGSLMTYASCPGEATAPGQFDYETTIEMLCALYPKYQAAKSSSKN